MTTPEIKQLVTFAVLTRISIFIIQFLANVLIPDHQADAFKPINSSHLGYFTERVIGGFNRWDSQHFLFIAKNGYVLETSLAFFPLLPVLSRLLSGCFLMLLAPLFTQEALLLIAALILNCYCFVQSAVLHYRFSRDLLKSHQLSLLVSMLFCINPASIFMSAGYTEALYHMLTMFGLVYLRSERPFLAALCFCLSAACRSNGAVNVLYLILYVVHANYVKLAVTLQPKKGQGFLKRMFSAAWIIIDSSSTFLFLTAACVAPYFIFQFYAYSVHCTRSFAINPSSAVIAFARANNLRLLSDEPPSPWCNYSLPFSYSFLQERYWGVGFLSYFQLKQIPNFILAFPAILLTSSCLLLEFKELYTRVVAAWQNRSIRLLSMPYTSAFMMLLAFHLAFILLLGVFVANVQIVTRLVFSSSPLLYWYVARIIITDAIAIPELRSFFLDQQRQKKNSNSLTDILMNNPLTLVFAHWHLLSLRVRLILCYFVTYFVIGTVLFANFFPWT